jgi:AhpD family alkylhydroperoxidase
MPPSSSPHGIAAAADHRKIAARRLTGLFECRTEAYWGGETNKGARVMIEPLRMDIPKLAPEVYRHLLQIEGVIASRIDHKLHHLIKVRASQINGCAYCIAMHTHDALKEGESAERLLMLDAWHESSLFDEKERAVLEWVEEITLIAEGHAHQEAFDALKPHFSEEEIAALTLGSAMINTWNRIAIASRAQYDPAMFEHRPQQQKVPEPA